MQWTYEMTETDNAFREECVRLGKAHGFTDLQCEWLYDMSVYESFDLTPDKSWEENMEQARHIAVTFTDGEENAREFLASLKYA